MPAELTQWTCPACGRQAVIPANHGVIYCACGACIRDGQLTEQGRKLAERRKICLTCAHGDGRRCTLIDLGCARTYRQELAKDPPGCPLGLLK